MLLNRLLSGAVELIYPFGNGLAVQYFFTERLVSWTIAIASIGAETAPYIEVGTLSSSIFGHCRLVARGFKHES